MISLDQRPASWHEAASNCPEEDRYSPADRYQELFRAVQSDGVFPDSKTFVDCAPRVDPEAILAAYRAQCEDADFDLHAFVHRHFDAPVVRHSDYVSVPGQSLTAHIDSLWPALTRHPKQHPQKGSAVQLPHPYVVPGGRFRELYYWDSYFTMLGLAQSGCHALLQDMTDNFAYLIDTFGHVPNGTRTYYLSRSQPPVFALMVELCEAHGGQPATDYLRQLRREHAYWMDGAETVGAGDCARRVVRLRDGALLNRYWDDRDTPREESWREDVATAGRSDRPAAEVYRNLRAACESGWDFSSRWLCETEADGSPSSALADICTVDILPVDLNAFLYKLETTIARLSKADGDPATGEDFEARAAHRRAAIDALMWDASKGGYFDYDWRQQKRRHCFTAATVAPLFVGASSRRQAAVVANSVRERLLAPGGLSTTECHSGQQWDRPNGWAPLQWMAVRGFDAYGQSALAQDIRARWMRTVCVLYRRDSKLVEKYRLRESTVERVAGGGGGEYPLQDGFGWTNGVVRHWLDLMGPCAWAKVQSNPSREAAEASAGG
ncbi:MAG: alpha,alpha-trehalase TreF [Gammaproteobacteria bacterium]|nr:alpha,alpha-trehalase TreF [Gammaproteobacteria bacterium]MBU2285134.1 alpha,alpha-trehalase TreF [Gammaproteobacteria bacterium]